VSLLGARFRVHALVPIWVLAELINAGRTDRNSLLHVVPALGLMLLLAFVKEIARVGYARRSESPVSMVVLWPLGALAVQSRGPLRGWKPYAAPLAGIACLSLIMASMFVLVGGDPQLLLFNPLAPQPQIAALTTTAQVACWWGWYAGAVLVLANLLPILPLDAGRLMDARLARGGAAAGVLQLQVLGTAAAFIAAVFADQPRVVIASAVACVACWIALRRLAFVPVGEPLVKPGADTGMPHPDDSPEEVDRILAKVSARGLGSLSEEERAVLRRASARLRGGE
jgi:Zn-dependent protease